MNRTLTCRDCGKPMKWQRTSLPQGLARCHPCRRTNPERKPADPTLRMTLKCADCGCAMWEGRTSLPQGKARCLTCRRARPTPKRRYPPKGPRIRSRGFCAGCATWFEATGQHVRFCSLPCANGIRGRLDVAQRRQITNRRKRVRRLLPYIGHRDRWRCGICAGVVEPGPFSASNPLCAVVDHIVPIAEGGSDEPANLRLSHMICNARRGTRGGFEQLALVG